MDRLGNLIANLPPDSNVLKVVEIPDDAPEREWTRLEQLLALLLETTDAATKLQVKLWAKSPPRMKPLRIEWPGRDETTTTQKPKPSSPSDIAAFLGKRGGTMKVIDRGP